MSLLKGQNPILTNALIFWGIKFVIMVVIYFWLIAPNLKSTDPAVSNIVNIAYAFLTIFVVFALKDLNVSGLFRFRR